MQIRGMKIFVTGGAGFIGSHMVESLVRQGAKVKVYDNFSSGLLENLGEVAQDVEIVTGDILDTARLEKEMKGFEMVSHQAAQLEITRCLDNPLHDLEQNTIGTLNVLNAALQNGVVKVVNASSACTYGQARYVPEDEEHPQVPNWAYGVSKLAAERYGRVFAETHGMSVVSLRYAIIYGEREWYGRVLTIFLKRLLAGLPPVVFGEGAQERDFTYVGDVVRLHERCLELDEIRNESFNVSTGVATSVRDLALAVAELARQENRSIGDIVFEAVSVGGRSQLVENERLRLPQELEKMVLSPEKAGRLLGWKPEIMLKEGLRREFAWLATHSGRWAKMSY